MLIKDSGINGIIVDCPVEASLQKIGVQIYKASGLVEVTSPDEFNIAINRMKKGGGSVTIMSPMTLRAAFEIASSNQGHFGHTTLAGTILMGTIDISSFGTLLLDDEYLTVSITKTGSASTFGVKLYAIEGDEYNRSCLQYVPNVVLADTPKTVPVADCHKIAFPTAGLQKLVLTYADGRTATYTQDEVEMLCKSVNDIVCVTSNATVWSITTGYGLWFVLPIENVVTAQVHFTLQTKFFTIRNV